MERGPLMLNTTTFVGLDVHARSMLRRRPRRDDRRGPPVTFAYDAAVAVAEWVGSFDPKAEVRLRVGRPGSTCRRSSRRWASTASSARSRRRPLHRPPQEVNDRNDAEFLARMLSVGNVVCVRARRRGGGAARDLVARWTTRAIEALQQRLSKFLMRHGIRVQRGDPDRAQEGQLTAAHWAWIRSYRVSRRPTTHVLAYYVDAVRQAMEDKKRLERLVEAERRPSPDGRRGSIALPEGRRRHDGRRHRVRGRRVLQVW